MTEAKLLHTWLATLTAQGKLAAAALDRVERLHAETSDPLDVILARLGLVAETDIAQAFADALAIPLALAADVPAEPILPDQLRPDFLRPARSCRSPKPPTACTSPWPTRPMTPPRTRSPTPCSARCCAASPRPRRSSAGSTASTALLPQPTHNHPPRRTPPRTSTACAT